MPCVLGCSIAVFGEHPLPTHIDNFRSSRQMSCDVAITLQELHRPLLSGLKNSNADAANFVTLPPHSVAYIPRHVTSVPKADWEVVRIASLLVVRGVYPLQVLRPITSRQFRSRVTPTKKNRWSKLAGIRLQFGQWLEWWASTTLVWVVWKSLNCHATSRTHP